jgi:hypothetical protein
MLKSQIEDEEQSLYPLAGEAVTSAEDAVLCEAFEEADREADERIVDWAETSEAA